MLPRFDDTIAAVATAPGGAYRAVVRISGPKAVACVAGRFSASNGNGPATSDARLERLLGPTALDGWLDVDGLRLPLECQLYCWPNRRSYTREPVVEIHTIGSPPLVDALLRTVCRSGARLAEPGEFTMRAFLAGRIDLPQAEAVLGVIDAANGQQLDTALAQLAGGLSRPLGELRGRLLDLLAHLEAGLDFVEEDIQFITPLELDEQLARAAALVERLVEQMADRGQAGSEPNVVLLGWPNAGKSSLFNALAQGAALVSEVAGTTRDYLAARLDLDGAACQLIDTAGIEPNAPQASIAAEAAAMTSHWLRHADVRLLCLDAQRLGREGLNDWESRQLHERSAARLVVLTKGDEVPAVPSFDKDRLLANENPILTSSRTGQGIAVLRERIGAAIRTTGHAESSVVAGTAARCGESLRAAAESLARARELALAEAGEELVAAEVRLALDELGRVVGAVYTDDVLDRIFSRFCIGK